MTASEANLAINNDDLLMVRPAPNASVLSTIQVVGLSSALGSFISRRRMIRVPEDADIRMESLQYSFRMLQLYQLVSK